MSKTTTAAKLVKHAEKKTPTELTDDQLDTVQGGSLDSSGFDNPIIAGGSPDTSGFDNPIIAETKLDRGSSK